MNFILFDDYTRFNLLPFTHTRPIADIRCGILTMRERWELLLQHPASTLTENYLQGVYPLSVTDDNLFINASVFGSLELLNEIYKLQPEEVLVSEQLIIAARLITGITSFDALKEKIVSLKSYQYKHKLDTLNNIWDIFSLNDKATRNDFALITSNRKSAPIPANVMVSGSENIFIEEGGNIGMGSIINATTGPVYIGKNATILEGVMIHGPLAICEQGVIKMGAKIYGATTIGPGCKVGGEISNVVFFANSNKGHDGYLGNAVIGEWCNLGADTNCSNLKNNYDEIKIYNEHTDNLVKSGLVFCGLMMADHSKCGINTMFNTGTVVGVSSNIFGSGFPDKFIPSFTWGGIDEMTTYNFDKAIETANRMMGRRGKNLSSIEIEMYRHIFEFTKAQRQ